MASYGASQEKYAAQVAAYNQNYQNALAQGRAADLSLTQRQMQEGAAYSEKDHLALVEGAVKQAQVASAAASSGVAGPTVASLVDAVGQQIAAKRTTLETNWQNTAAQLQSSKTSQVMETGMRIGEVAPPTNPGATGAILDTSGAALKAAGSPSGQSGLASVGLNIAEM
jgi:nicotinamide mononucleotide (NMN) deamidase PncC